MWSHGGQFLFDVAWLDARFDQQQQDFDWRHTRSLKLACESEWGHKEYEILEDFLKLTFAFAELRLFVYWNHLVKLGNGDKSHPADLCRQATPLSRGFRYLLVGFPSDASGEFRVDSWVA
jgi:hypothetical protein